MTRRRAACFACGRVVAVRFPVQTAGGKARAPHRCPHGRQCIAGSPYGGQGFNGAPTAGRYGCRECSARRLSVDAEIRAARTPAEQ